MTRGPFLERPIKYRSGYVKLLLTDWLRRKMEGQELRMPQTKNRSLGMSNRHICHIQSGKTYCAVFCTSLALLADPGTLYSCPRRPRSYWSAPSKNHDLWAGPTADVRDSRTFRQIWQIWLIENRKQNICAYSENRVWPLRGRDFWCWPKGARPPGKRMTRVIMQAAMVERTADC